MVVGGGLPGRNLPRRIAWMSLSYCSAVGVPGYILYDTKGVEDYTELIDNFVCVRDRIWL